MKLSYGINKLKIMLSEKLGAKTYKAKNNELIPEFKNRSVLVGVVKNTRQFEVLLRKRFYHIPMSQLSGCYFPIKYVAIYQSKKLFGKSSGIKICGTVLEYKTVKRKDITELPKPSEENYLYLKIGNWYKLPKTIEANEMEGAAFSTTPYLLGVAKESAQLAIRSAEEFVFLRHLTDTVKRLVKNHTPDGEDVVYKDYTVKLKGGCLHLYFGEVPEYVIGYDVFLNKPTDVIRDIFDYYPENYEKNEG